MSCWVVFFQSIHLEQKFFNKRLLEVLEFARECETPKEATKWNQLFAKQWMNNSVNGHKGSLNVKESDWDTGQNYFQRRKTLLNVPQIGPSYNSLDIFERPRLLIFFVTNLKRKADPNHAPNGPSSEIEIIASRAKILDLQDDYLEAKSEKEKSGWKKIQYRAIDSTEENTPLFVNNALHSFFSNRTVNAKGNKVPSVNENYSRKFFFLETEFSKKQKGKRSVMEFSRLKLKNPGTSTNQALTDWEAGTRQGNTLSLIGKNAAWRRIWPKFQPIVQTLTLIFNFSWY